MAVLEKDGIILYKDKNGNTNIVKPVTTLSNIEANADIKETPAEEDFIPIIDSEDNEQIKMISVSKILQGNDSVSNENTDIFLKKDKDETIEDHDVTFGKDFNEDLDDYNEKLVMGAIPYLTVWDNGSTTENRSPEIFIGNNILAGYDSEGNYVPIKKENAQTAYESELNICTNGIIINYNRANGNSSYIKDVGLSIDNSGLNVIRTEEIETDENGGVISYYKNSYRTNGGSISTGLSKVNCEYPKTYGKEISIGKVEIYGDVAYPNSDCDYDCAISFSAVSNGNYAQVMLKYDEEKDTMTLSTSPGKDDWDGDSVYDYDNKFNIGTSENPVTEEHVTDLYATNIGTSEDNKISVADLMNTISSLTQRIEELETEMAKCVRI